MSELKNWIFTQKQWDEIIDHSINKSLDVIGLCDDVESVDYIIDNNKNITAIELHATGLNDYFLLDSVKNFRGKIILGIGGSSLDEIQYAIDFFKINGKDDIILMYGFQSYPTNYTEINLSKMKKINKFFQVPVGYADHTAYDDPNNEIISILAAAMGFNILEKHYTLNPGQERIDFHAAVGREQMIKIKKYMELVLNVYGTGQMSMSKPELDYGNVGPMKKAIVAKRKIKKGETLSLDDLWYKRTVAESTIKQNQLFQLIGLEVIEDIEEDEIIDFKRLKYKVKK
jgi:sialic acid synthase SpsE